MSSSHHSTLRSTKTSSFETRTTHISSSIRAGTTTQLPSIETTAAVSSPTQNTLSPTASATPESKPPIAAIVGGAAGGGAGLLLIIGLLIYYVLHAKKSRNQHRDEVVQRLSDLPSKMNERNSPDHGGQNEASTINASPNPYQAYPYVQAPPPTHTDKYFEPTTAHSPSASLADKPLANHRFSELSGETAIRSEGESSWSSPNPYSTSQSPQTTVLGSPRWDPYAHSRQHSGQVMWADGGQWAQQETRGHHMV